MKVYHYSDTVIKNFSPDHARPYQIWGVYFAKEGAKEWGNRRYKYTFETGKTRLCPSDIARETFLEESGKGKNFGKITSQILKKKGYQGVNIGKNEIVVFDISGMKLLKMEDRGYNKNNY